MAQSICGMCMYFTKAGSGGKSIDWCHLPIKNYSTSFNNTACSYWKSK